MKTKQYKLERIERFQVADLPMPDPGTGEMRYALKVVTPAGQQVDRPCTQQAYKDYLRFKPDRRTKVNFALKINEDGLVYDYNEVVLAPETGLFEQEMPDGRIIKSVDHVICERQTGKKEWEAVFWPKTVGANTVEAILGAIQNSPHLEVEQQLLDKYPVLEIAQRAGVEVVTVDLAR